MTPPPARPGGGNGSESRITDDDVFLFNEGTHRRLADKLGAHRVEGGGPGWRLAVWAPNATTVAVAGDFNGWRADAHPLWARDRSGIWEGTVAEAEAGQVYKYAVTTRSGAVLEKADPFAFVSEPAPGNGSVLWDLGYQWGDEEWMAGRGARIGLDAPVAVYELHLGSWRRPAEAPGRFMTYDEVADPLIEHVRATGYTHVELLPVMEHPFYGSWGYQVTGFFAPTSRYGTPQQLMGLIDRLHQAGVGVILDWVPSHFPSDPFALGNFDGTHLYEHADPRLGYHPEWTSLIFNYGRHEVRSFLASSAEHWLGAYHADGLRVDAVASMLYLDYARRPGEWLPNAYGGRENLEAMEFLRQLNVGIYADHPDVQTIAEESTSWPGVSHPTDLGGLGFGLKWDMGWMHDTLGYLATDALYRRYRHRDLTFRGLYAFTENFLLPLSHDEAVHGKGSLLNKMAGDTWQKFANLRLLYGYQYAQPGKKLLFMGGEFAQWREWRHDAGLDWELLGDDAHAGICRWVSDLNRLYREVPALHQLDTDPSGVAWVESDEAEICVLSFLRRSAAGDAVLVVCNFTPVPREHHLVGVPDGGFWRELLNSDATAYGGSGMGNFGGVEAQPVGWHDWPRALTLTLPPLGCLFLGRDRR